MPSILSGIQSLNQHLSTLLKKPSDYRPTCCKDCGKTKLWSHGFYTRKAGCEEGHGNPALIPRFLCPHCLLTCSVLPEYIPPKRWYHWAVQEVVFRLLLSGSTYNNVLNSLCSLSLERQGFVEPSMSTLHRWWSRFKSDYLKSRFCLCHYFPSLGLTNELSTLWLSCLEKMPLSSAMALLFNTQSDDEIMLHY
jgi:hypothetical protein